MLAYSVLYRHATTHCSLAFVRMKLVGGDALSPVGCFLYRADRVAAVFEKRENAESVAGFLTAMGHCASVRRDFVSKPLWPFDCPAPTQAEA